MRTQRTVADDASFPGWPPDSEVLRRYVIADVFASTPLEGNQVAVFLEAVGLSDDLMQRTARELNLSETVFVLPSTADADVRVRIFTPTSELPFAGHPVLGTAFIVAEAAGTETVRIETGVGVVLVRMEREGARITFGRMEQPIPSAVPYEHTGELLQALGVSASTLPVEGYRNGPLHVFVGLDSQGSVAALQPALNRLAALSGVAANCFAGAGRHWKTRVFGPSLGVSEDPATGSAAGPLAVHLARHGQIGFGEEIEIEQGVEIGRPSVLYACAHGTSDRIDRVTVGGSAVVVAKGEYLLA